METYPMFESSQSWLLPCYLFDSCLLTCLTSPAHSGVQTRAEDGSGSALH